MSRQQSKLLSKEETSPTLDAKRKRKQKNGLTRSISKLGYVDQESGNKNECLMNSVKNPEIISQVIIEQR